MKTGLGQREIIVIPDDITGSDILCLLFPSRSESASEKEAAELLHRVCFVSLRDLNKPDNINNIRLTEDELKVVLLNKWCESSNLEVKARCNDVMSRYDKDKREKNVTFVNANMNACMFQDEPTI